MGAKSDDVVCFGTRGDASGVIVSVGVGLRASYFEDLGVSRGPARLWVTERAGATVAR